MTRSKVKVTRPLKLEILQFSKSISSPIFNVSWQMTTDSETTEQYLTFVIFDICPSFCHVTTNLERGNIDSVCKCIHQVAAAFGVDPQYSTGLIFEVFYFWSTGKWLGLLTVNRLIDLIARIDPKSAGPINRWLSSYRQKFVSFNATETGGGSGGGGGGEGWGCSA